MPKCSVLVFAFLVGLTGCDDEGNVTEPQDAAVDAAASTVVAKYDAGVGSDTMDAFVVANDAQPEGPDAPMAEFSWSIDPMSVKLRRGTCRELLVQVVRRPDFKDAITLGVGNSPFRVGFASLRVEEGSSVGTIILATPYNTPTVTDHPMIIAASGNATYLRLTLNVTVLDEAPATDGGVVETFADAGSWDNDTCSETVAALSTIMMM